tara:strand:+ start:715 stop:894 length:180 start_codon:yes stop_codon:yes gene_type:complete
MSLLLVVLSESGMNVPPSANFSKKGEVVRSDALFVVDSLGGDNATKSAFYYTANESDAK